MMAVSVRGRIRQLLAKGTSPGHVKSLTIWQIHAFRSAEIEKRGAPN